MSEQNLGTGVVYTETVVWSAPEQYVSEAPYQIAIVSLASGGRVTARVAGERVGIGDPVQFIEYRNHFPVFQKA
jgi:uncharacterized OB-fold protein